MDAQIRIYGATEFEAPGMHWQTPHRALGEQPTNVAEHEALVQTAEHWIREHLPWLLAAAGMYGLYLHTDGMRIFLCLPGEGTPPQLAMHLIGVIGPAAQPPLASGKGQPLQ